MTAMVAQERALGSDQLDDDRLAAAWLADWEALVGACERYADALAAGRSPRLVVPSADGIPLTDRINSTGLACEMPPELVSLP